MLSDPDPAAPSSSLQDLRGSRLLDPPPSDFSEFWLGTLKLLAEQSAEPLAQTSTQPGPREWQVQPTELGAAHASPPPPAATSAFYRSWEGRRIHAFFSPRRPGTHPGYSGRPLLVSCHGYGGQADPERVRRLCTFGFDVVSFDARGFGRSTEDTTISPDGYVLTGMEAKESSILRGAVCDYLQARRAAHHWFGAPTYVAFQGFSFAGGLALMAAGVLGLLAEQQAAKPRTSEPLPRDLTPPDLVAAGAPTFGAQSLRLQLCQEGSGAELGRYLSHHPSEREQMLSVLRYFDTVYFAPSVKGRVIFGVGIDDPVVPALTVYPIKNALPTPPELFELPCSHTTRPEEQEWIRWESCWIRALRKA